MIHDFRKSACKEFCAKKIQHRFVFTTALPSFFGESQTHPSGLTSILNYHRDSNYHIIHPEKTLFALYRALMFLRRFQQKQKRQLRILFLNTNPELTHIVEQNALLCQQYYINTKWVGGTLTNWKQVSKSIQAFRAFQRKWMPLLTKKNLHFPRLEKMQKCFSGYDSIVRQRKIHPIGTTFDPPKFFTVEKATKLLETELGAKRMSRNQISEIGLFLSGQQSIKKDLQFPMNHSMVNEARKKRSNKATQLNRVQKPDVIVILDPHHQQTAIEEAILERIPVIAFVNSDTRIHQISYPIPGNNQNHDFMHFCINQIAKVVTKK